MMGYEEYLKQSIKDHKTGIKKNPIDEIGYKLKGHKLARKNGVKTTVIYGIYRRIEDVDWESLPFSFTIKPQQGCSESGVFPLVNKFSFGYRDILRNRLLTKGEIINEFKSGNHSEGLWIEELIADPIPYDWKIYTFNGRIGLIRQYDRVRKPKSTKFYNENWVNVNVHKIARTYKINNKLPEPIHKEELLEVARKLSKAVKYPFVRIDLYDTFNGVYFGEITPHPGMEITLNDLWNERLGVMWDLAIKELNNE